MQNFQLRILFHIIGIGSASGLFYKDNSVFLISDNGGYLYEYHIGSESLEKIPIIESEILENIPKKAKPDFESLVYSNGKFLAFGSGSTEKRNTMVTVDTNSKEISSTDLSALYAAMQGFAKISADDFNIEGVAYDGENWYFFQRGNGAKAQNGVFTVSGKNLEYDFSFIYNKIKLPKIDGVRASFTDAILVGGQIYFLAAAENTTSTYHDGEILGSLVGVINPKTMKVTATKKITDTHKFEGITLYEENQNTITFLLCEDNDSDVLDASVYKLELDKRSLD